MPFFAHSVSGLENASTTSAWIPETLISFDFDDGNENAYTIGLPIINNAGYKATEYIITGRMNAPGFVSSAEVLDMQAKGNEVGGHTMHHVNLALSTDAIAKQEIEGSRSDLLKLGIKSVTAFAYPLGAATTSTPRIVKESGFILARLTYDGFDDPTINPFELRRIALNANTTPEKAIAAIDYAIANKKWLILVMHHIDQDNSQSISSALLKQVVAYVKEKNLKVVTATEGFNLVFATSSVTTASSTPVVATSTPPVIATSTVTNASSTSATTTPSPVPTPPPPSPPPPPPPPPPPISGGGGGGFYPQAAPSMPVTTTTPVFVQPISIPIMAGTVLGASIYHFSRQLWRGMSGDDVFELQKILKEKEFLQIDAPTRYFGTRTEQALAAYQNANGLVAVGRVGPKTLALLNADSGPQTIDRQSLIDSLRQRVQMLLAQITALQKTASTTP